MVLCSHCTPWIRVWGDLKKIKLGIQGSEWEYSHEQRFRKRSYFQHVSKENQNNHSLCLYLGLYTCTWEISWRELIPGCTWKVSGTKLIHGCTWEVGQGTKIFPAVLGIWAKSSTCTWEQILYCTWDHHPLTDLQNENDTFFWTVKIFSFFLVRLSQNWVHINSMIILSYMVVLEAQIRPFLVDLLRKEEGQSLTSHAVSVPILVTWPCTISHSNGQTTFTTFSFTIF